MACSAHRRRRHYFGWTPPPCRPSRPPRCGHVPAPRLFDHHADAPFLLQPRLVCENCRPRRSRDRAPDGSFRALRPAGCHHCRPRERSPEIVAYTAPLRDSVLSTGSNALRRKSVDENSPTWRPRLRPIHRAAIVLHWFLAAVIVVGFLRSACRCPRTGFARGGALDQLPQVDWRDDPGPFGAEAAVAVFRTARRRCPNRCGLAAQCHALVTGRCTYSSLSFAGPVGHPHGAGLSMRFTWGLIRLPDLAPKGQGLPTC